VTIETLQAQAQLIVRQRIRLTVNQYEVHAVNPDGNEGGLLAFAQQKRLAFKEQVTMYADDTRTRPVLGFKAHLEQPGLGEMVGRETNAAVAVLRRFFESLSWLPYHFEFLIDERPAFSVIRRWSLRDRYVVTIHDPQLDRRLVAAMAVALDALQSR
jgi:hypothetical protein